MPMLAQLAADHPYGIAAVLIILWLCVAPRVWHRSPLPDVALLIGYVARPNLMTLLGLLAIICIRHSPALSGELARALGLLGHVGWTDRAIRLLLPELARPAMSSPAPATAPIAPGPPVQVLVPGIADTNAIPTGDRDSMKQAWIAPLARSKDSSGRYLFSANQIYAAIGGHRSDVLDQIRAIRDEAPAVYRSDDGIGPASYPVSKGGPA